MTKLIKLLEIEVRNLDDYLDAENYEGANDTDLSLKLWNLINAYKDKEDVEIKEYVNDSEFYLYNIHTTEDSLYIERYDSIMNDINYEEVIQESKCRDITDEIDIIEFLLKNN